MKTLSSIRKAKGAIQEAIDLTGPQLAIAMQSVLDKDPAKFVALWKDLYREILPKQNSPFGSEQTPFAIILPWMLTEEQLAIARKQYIDTEDMEDVDHTEIKELPDAS